MLSQYTWWDFIKVVGTGLVIYYAYVAWAYYREDIREWISNRGQPERPVPAQPDESEEESDDSSLYSVSNYAKDTTPASAETVDEEPNPDTEPDEEDADTEPAPVTAQANPDDSQAIVAEETIPGSEADLAFEMTIQIEPIKPTERSLGAVLRAAQSLHVDEQGRLLADEDATTDTKELADTLNEQKGFDSVLSGINFNR